MFIIWGFGKQTVKSYGIKDSGICRHCNNDVNMGLLKITKWFTLFFIPIIPYSIKYVSRCPICGIIQEFSKEEFFEIVKNSPEYVEANKYAGKTETQINFLKQVEEFRRKEENEQM